MAAISQVIPNYVQGISNQPDELKTPGQVRDLKNAWPDVTRGCMKRLGSKLIGELDTGPDGTWFTIDRAQSPADQFIGNISNVSNRPRVEIWNMNGVKMPVTYANYPIDGPPKKNKKDKVVEIKELDTPNGPMRDYLRAKPNLNYDEDAQRNEELKYHPLKVCQGDGKTFILNDQVTPNYTIDNSQNPDEYFESYISLRQVQYQREYLLAFDDPMKNDADENIEWDYATNIGDVMWESDPNGALFTEPQQQTVCQLQMAYQRFTVNSQDAVGSSGLSGETSKIVTVSTTRPDGEALELSLEVLCRALQEIDRHVKNPAKDEYRWRSEYTPRVQLLKGGRNWKAGDKVTIAYKPDSANIDEYWDGYLQSGYMVLELTIGDNSNSVILADIGYVSVKTDKNDSDETIPFASANDIILGLCHGLEQGGAVPLKFDENGIEVPATEPLYPNPPSTVSVYYAGAEQEGVTEDVAEEDKIKGGFLTPLGLEFKPIGNGIYIRKKATEEDGPQPFKLVTPEDQLFNHMSTKEKDEWYCTIHAVSRLPNQCRHGLHVLVKNTENNNEDDYYVKFVGHDDVDGEGSWEETVKPGLRVQPDWATMPHEIVWDGDHFIVTPVYWQAREVGDENTAPSPSFLPETVRPEADDFKFIRKITGMAWYRNRFILFADKAIVASADGDYYNFWPKTARTVTDADPIDISATAKQPSPIVDSVEMTAGLVLFGKDEQFLLTTDADGMRPGTAKVMAIANYDYNTECPPVKMGTSIAFLSDAGLNDKLFEMGQVAREGSEPQVVEISKLVEPRLPDNINLLTSSKSNMVVMMAKYWTNDYMFAPQTTMGDEYRLFNHEKFREVWGYRYFDNGQRRVQSAWFRWTFDFPICYHTILDDNYYVVLYNKDEHLVQLRKVGLKFEDELRDVYLDGYFTGCPEGCYYADSDKTLLLLDSHLWREDECVYFEMYNKQELLDTYKCGDKFEACRTAFGIVKKLDEDGYKPCSYYVLLDGNWLQGCDGSDIDCDDPENPWRITAGKIYDMVVDLPTVYVGKQSGDKYNAKWDPNLNIHRMKFSTGPSKYEHLTYKIEIKRKSREMVSQWHDVIFDYPYTTEKPFTQPIYMRNTDIDVKFISSDPHGGILYSMQWEGDFNPKWYKYV